MMGVRPGCQVTSLGNEGILSILSVVHLGRYSGGEPPVAQKEWRGLIVSKEIGLRNGNILDILLCRLKRELTHV